jgi:hypothetical protein
MAVVRPCPAPLLLPLPIALPYSLSVVRPCPAPLLLPLPIALPYSLSVVRPCPTRAHTRCAPVRVRVRVRVCGRRRAAGGGAGSCCWGWGGGGGVLTGARGRVCAQLKAQEQLSTKIKDHNLERDLMHQRVGPGRRPARPAPLPRTKWTRRVLHPVLTGRDALRPPRLCEVGHSARMKPFLKPPAAPRRRRSRPLSVTRRC